MPATPEIGQIVNVRARQYLVESVTPPIHPQGDTLVSLACLNDDAQGQVLEVFWAREIDAEILGNSTWEQVAQRGFDRPHYFSAYLHTLRWNCVTSTNPKLFQAPYRAGIEVKAYQLEPLRKALLMPRVSLFIADDVGLGKTILQGERLRQRGGANLAGNDYAPEDSAGGNCLSAFGGATMARGDGEQIWAAISGNRSRVLCE
jgi:hypothetical protein